MVYPEKIKRQLDLAKLLSCVVAADFSSENYQLFHFFSPKVQFWGIGCEDASRHLFLHRQWQDLEGQGQVMALDCGWRWIKKEVPAEATSVSR